MKATDSSIVRLCKAIERLREKFYVKPYELIDMNFG